MTIKATVLSVSILLEDDEGNVSALESDEIENMTIEAVMGDMLHTSKTKVEFFIPDGAQFTQVLMGSGEHEDEDEDDE